MTHIISFLTHAKVAKIGLSGEPGNSEPFGLTMLEAMSTAKPMIVTEAGGMPEIIKDGINGFVVPVKDFESLASRVTQLLSNNDLRNRLGYTGRDMVERHYTKEIIAENTLRLYRKFC